MIQLVIEITEEDYNNIEPFLNGETIKGGFNLFKALEIIKNGKPLSSVIDGIKAEITDLHNSHMINFVDADGAVDTCLEIIDKHIGKESE